MSKKIRNLGKWKLNKVYEEDASIALKEIPENCIDIAVTSPPYWGQRGDKGIGSEPDPRDYIRNLTEILLKVMHVLKPTGLLWLNVGDAYNTPINWSCDDYKYSSLGRDRKGFGKDNTAYTKNRGHRRAFIDKSVGWLKYGNLLGLPYRIVLRLCDEGVFFRGEVIWYKRNPMPEGRCRRPQRKHESIYIFAKSEKHCFTVSQPISSVWDIKPNMNRINHTSTFPLDLPLTCIKVSGVEKGIVLDPFMGSGTSGLAAKMLGFDFIGFDINKENVEVANKRINEKLGLFSDL